ncbi:hypothetical protein [[Mycobacterium] crassicus]|uniref:Uncharacterized protein n=1 Tax=[Mycobacterium] crassicus TaxID=2872309 RepID=A0ABU5XDA8_9MYCO|nr:hypothetical protein [Mycolicibacter sp. MYC098]MEB3020272.1 hypothetical protein [Mycolicibacter sp. MYC098]
MALKKSDLYGPRGRSCDELCGGMDVRQYKDYILTLLLPGEGARIAWSASSFTR